MPIATRDLQTGLFRLGFDPGGIDGVDGPKTRAAVAAFMASVPDDPDLTHAIRNALNILPPFIQAAHFTPSNRPTSAPIDLIVVHTMEAPEKPQTALAVARWFAGESAPQASAHYCVDATDVVQCVLECDVAWAAPGANRNGVHIEHAGYAGQTSEQWADAYSQATLEHSAELAAKLAKRFNVPLVKLTVAELAAGGRGFIGHVDATNAFCAGRGHTDPGANFVWDRYLDMVRASS